MASRGKPKGNKKRGGTISDSPSLLALPFWWSNCERIQRGYIDAPDCWDGKLVLQTLKHFG
jgi:hypothetical protein